MVKFDISQAENVYLIYNICMKKLSKRARIGTIVSVVVLCVGVVGVTAWLIFEKANETTNEAVDENTETAGVEEVAEKDIIWRKISSDMRRTHEIMWI